jgi:hypothetical protein
MSVHHLTEADVHKRAIEQHECPDCDAAAGKRCRTLTRYAVHDGSGTVRTKVDVKRKPCPDRAQLAYRELLREASA